MEFLGNLGIDIRLLIAQIINFILLLFILTKFLYKPIIKRIEREESELDSARKNREELEKEKELWLSQKNQEIIHSRREAQKIIKEAQVISKDLQQKSSVETEAFSSQLIQQTKNKLETVKLQTQKRVLKDLRGDFLKSFQKIFNFHTGLTTKDNLMNLFWSDFIKKVRVLRLKKISGLNLLTKLEKIKSSDSTKGKSILQKELDKLIVKKIGPVVLQYSHPLDKEQFEELNNLLSKKIGVPIKVIKKYKKSLINGLSLEVAGVIVEVNLLNIINNIFIDVGDKIKKKK